jgi:hypothetical protein
MDASIGLTHFTSAAIVVYAMNKLKSATWFPLVQKDWTMLNRGFSMFVAFAVSVGIHYTWTADTAGGHTLVLQIPTLAVLGLGVWHWLNQFALQETLFQITKTKDVAPKTS